MIKLIRDKTKLKAVKNAWRPCWSIDGQEIILELSVNNLFVSAKELTLAVSQPGKSGVSEKFVVYSQDGVNIDVVTRVVEGEEPHVVEELVLEPTSLLIDTLRVKIEIQGDEAPRWVSMRSYIDMGPVA